MLKENTLSIDSFIRTDEDIQRVKRIINMASVLPFKGTMRVHQVINNHGEICVLQMKSMSCFKCIDQHKDNLQSYQCTHFTTGKIEYPLEDQIEKASASNCITKQNISQHPPGDQLEAASSRKCIPKQDSSQQTLENQLEMTGTGNCISNQCTRSPVYWKDLQTCNLF